MVWLFLGSVEVRWSKLDYIFFAQWFSSVVTAIAIDNMGNKWFGTQNSGVSMYDGIII